LFWIDAGFGGQFAQILHVTLAAVAPLQTFIAALASSVVASIPMVLPLKALVSRLGSTQT